VDIECGPNPNPDQLWTSGVVDAALAGALNYVDDRTTFYPFCDRTVPER